MSKRNYENWFQKLETIPALTEWVSALREGATDWLSDDVRSDIKKWKDALAALPEVAERGFSVSEQRLCFAPAAQPSEEVLKQFHPWRKGPFSIGEVFIDTEWRSDWKWERVAPHLSLSGQKVLDIGCGNGYYLWRMLEAGAEWALGIDPYVPYIMQFKAMQHFGGELERAEVFPIGVEGLPRVAPVWDTVFSMGILYHQKSPLEHLGHCRDLLVKGGEFILETIVLPPEYDKVTDCLVPEGRYAKMKNVNFLPSVQMLESWLKKVRFKKVEVLDLCKSTGAEQRSTEWMTFQSLPDFLTEDEMFTAEGHPAPWRVLIKASI